MTAGDPEAALPASSAGRSKVGWRGRLFAAYCRSPNHPLKHAGEWVLRRSLRLADVTAESPGGVRYRLAPSDVVQRHILLQGAYEPATLALTLHLLPAGGTMVDVGAHVGQFALHASRAVGGAGRVVALEPNPRTYQRLLQNISLNEASNVLAVLGAVAERAGVAPMRLPPEGNWGMSRIAGAGDGADYRVVALPLGTVLDAVGVSRVDVLKIDVEGVEDQVLRSLDLHGPLRPRHIVFELIPELAAQQGSSSNELLGFLSAAGYALRTIEGEPYVVGGSLPEFNLWATDNGAR